MSVEKDLPSSEEKIRWEKFREDLKKVESLKLEKLKFYEKNPEKHPQYPEEWKSFWNRRYNELQRSGVDPSKHDFKPEWIAFWTKRMKELYEEDLGRSKDELKKKFDLPEEPLEKDSHWKNNSRKHYNTSPGLVDISPPTPEKKDVIADIKSTWKAFTGSDIKDAPKRSLSPWEEDYKSHDTKSPVRKGGRKHSPRSRSQSPATANEKLLEHMPQRKSKTSSLIFVLRKLTVLEQQLGSLAPRVFELLSQALIVEKIKEDASLDLLYEEESCVFLETVREKLIALLCAGVVPRNIVNTARSAIKHIDISLYLCCKRQRLLPIETLRQAIGLPLPNQNFIINQVTTTPPIPKSEPVVVPGVGQVDKAAIAQQIAVALVEQGKTNVTEADLEQLINAVIGMAEASKNSSQPMTTASFLHQLQSVQDSTPSIDLSSLQHLNANIQMFALTPQSSNDANKSGTKGFNLQPSTSCGGLKLLQSAYNESVKTDPDSPKMDTSSKPDASNSSNVLDKELTSTLAKFNSTIKEGQPNFLQSLQKANPDLYNRLCPFIPPDMINVSDHNKRAPIVIPISKARSEQKIKPLPQGRLSPFSSRSGGTNPTMNEGVEIEDDKCGNDDKMDVEFIGTQIKPRLLQENQSMVKYTSDGDEDDDDYSFEDVCKAAQEKLRQKQLEEEKQSNKIVERKDNTSEIIILDRESSKSKIDEIQNMETSNIITDNRLKHIITANENIQLEKQFSESYFKSPNINQQSLRFDTDQSINAPSRSSQYNSYPPLTYPTTVSRRQEQFQSSHSAELHYAETSPQTQPNTERYSNISAYSKSDSLGYERGNYGDSQSLPNRELHINPRRDAYSMYYRDNYNKQYRDPLHSEYEDNMRSYGDHYRYRDQAYGSDTYSQSRPPLSNTFAPSSRYPPDYPY